eukprot:SAG31_NODE_3156_length_4610_cov_12.728663_2_plen_144_part_00
MAVSSWFAGCSIQRSAVVPFHLRVTCRSCLSVHVREKVMDIQRLSQRLQRQRVLRTDQTCWPLLVLGVERRLSWYIYFRIPFLVYTVPYTFLGIRNEFHRSFRPSGSRLSCRALRFHRFAVPGATCHLHVGCQCIQQWRRMHD